VEQIKGKYLLEHLLGRGGMAEVFLGRTVGLAGFSRPVAIKRILPGCSADEHFQAMFIDEASLCARLLHPNVVSVLDFDADETGRLFLVMEYVDGTDLDGLLCTGLLPLPVVLFITKEILRGLGHAHDLPVGDDHVRGLVHRDVSPQNVLIAWDGAVKVSDFGIAKARTATRASASLQLKGKAAYMSPEQANGAVLDGRSDLFAVGVMLWEMLCGASLFGHDSLQATLKAVLFDPIPSPRARRPDLPRDIERITMKLLERIPEDRYRNADAAIAAIGACAAFPRGAFPDDGPALLSRLLVERLPDRARRRSAGSATRPASPALARGSAGADPEETVVAPRPPLPPKPEDPFRVRAPRRSRARRALPLALLGVATALTAGLAVGAAARRSSGAGGSLRSSSSPPPPISPVEHQPPSEARASTKAGAPRELAAAAAATATPQPKAAPPALDAQAPATATPDRTRSARERRAPAADRREPSRPTAGPMPARDTADRGGIRVIDLGRPSWQ
jgi:eukaryotic-like serine/threonine-protein kinase